MSTTSTRHVEVVVYYYLFCCLSLGFIACWLGIVPALIRPAFEVALEIFITESNPFAPIYSWVTHGAFLVAGLVLPIVLVAIAWALWAARRWPLAFR